MTLNFRAVLKITPNARASSLSSSRRSAAASSEWNGYPNPASPITSSAARASHGNTSSLHGPHGSGDCDLDWWEVRGWRERRVGIVGDDFEGTKAAKGLGRNDVVAADGDVAMVVAGSGSASPGAEEFSARANGSTGVKKAFGEAVMSSQMSRSFNFRF